MMYRLGNNRRRKKLYLDILQYLTENLSKYEDIGGLDNENEIYKKLYITPRIPQD